MAGYSMSKDNPSYSIIYGASGGRNIYRLRQDAVGLPGTAGLPAGIYQLAPALAAGNRKRRINENARVLLWSTNLDSGDSQSAFVWYYPAGAELFNGVIAPATRYSWCNGVNEGQVANPMNATGTNLMVDGLRVTMSNPAFGGVDMPIFNSQLSGPTTVDLTFRAASYEQAANFTLQSSATVNAGYTNDTTAVLTKPDPQWDFFHATTTKEGPVKFYRIHRN